MKKATIILTKRKWNPISWLIRWALPVSRFQWARASHSLILDGDHVIHATMLGGVVVQPLAEVLKHQVVVATKEFEVQDLDRGLNWARSQVGATYDFKGAFGVSLTPDRQWQEPDCWFCHELCAAFIHACGSQVFNETGHVTDTVLLSVSGKLCRP